MSNQKTKLRLHTFLRTLTPLHISSGQTGTFDVTNNRVYMGERIISEGSATTCSLVQTIAYLAPGEESGVANVPVIMANNIMGRLRRHAAALVLGIVQSKGQTISPGTYSALTCGASSGNPDSSVPTFDQLRTSMAHPYLGLFGGGPKLMRRYARMLNNPVPYTSVTAQSFKGIEHPNFDPLIHAVPSSTEKFLTRGVLRNRMDDLTSLSDIALASATITDFENAIRERASAIAGNKAAKAETGSSERQTTRSFTALQYVIPNVIFPLSWSLEVTPAQLGLFLLALDSFAADEELGGQGRNGFGRFNLFDMVLTDNTNQPIASSLLLDNKLNRDLPEVAQAIAAWEEAALDITGNSLNDLFANEVIDKSAGKGKRAAKEAA